MENDETKNQPVQGKSWLSGKEWLFALGFGVLAFLGFALPAYSTKLVADPDNRINVFFYEMMGGQYGFNWIIFLIWFLPLIGIAFAGLAKVKKEFLTASMLAFLLSGVLLFMAKDLFAYNLEGSVLREGKTDYAIGGVLAPCFCFIASFSALIGSAQKESYSVYDMVESGMLIAMAVVLNFIKIPMQVEGSVNFQMLPLFILALRQGPLKGFIGGGIVFGLITCLTDGYGFAFYPFDYLIGFGSCAVMGFFKPLIFGKDQKGYNLKGEIFLLVAGVLATFARFVGGCMSSMVLYGYDIAAASLYNVGYVFISGGIALAVIMALYGTLVKLNNRFQRKSELAN